jgi:hypothetical protein
MGRPCQACIASGEGFSCDAEVQDQDFGHTEEDEFEFAQWQQDLSDPALELPTATPDTPSVNQPAPITTADPIIPYLRSKEERANFLTNLAAVAVGGGNSNPTLSSIPQANLSTGDTSISEYADASAPDPFKDSMFSTGGSISDTLYDPIEEQSRGSGRSHPIPQQEMHNAASTWGQGNQYDSSASAPAALEDGDMEDAPFELDFDPDEMMEMLGPNPPSPPPIVPRQDVLLPGSVRAYGASWEPPGSSNTLRHVDVLSGYPDNQVRLIRDSLENNNCNEARYAFTPWKEEVRCFRRPGTRCEFLQTAVVEFAWPGPENHADRDPYHTCEKCRHDQNNKAREWEVQAKAAMKAFVCTGCSSELISDGKTRLATCICLDKLNNDWLCHYHREKGYDQMVIASGHVGAWLMQVGYGIQLCPRCYFNMEDQSSGVYACKSCRTYVEED